MKCYIDPKNKSALLEQNGFLVNGNGVSYPIIKHENFSIPLLVYNNSKELSSSVSYDNKDSVKHYIQFKKWLFKTFNIDEHEFRVSLMKKWDLSDSPNIKKILITGCGLGDDIVAAFNTFGKNIQIYSTDLSLQMVKYAIGLHKSYRDIKFSVCDAQFLPFSDNFFDVVFHFGGINLFPNISLAIQEMTRVVKDKGLVGFGDESVGHWLRNLEYGKMVINNNSLWSAYPPLESLPLEADKVRLDWVLGNCFYFISFVKKANGPYINLDIPHKSVRGGTIRTRYFGVLEGIQPNLKQEVIEHAKNQGKSISDFINEIISCYLEKNNNTRKNDKRKTKNYR
jgi:ubiquinone/menaquinone biosynthesis C-methylase UbiE